MINQFKKTDVLLFLVPISFKIVHLFTANKAQGVIDYVQDLDLLAGLFLDHLQSC